MFHALHIYLAFIFAMTAFLAELHYRAKSGMHPANIAEFYRWGQKRSTPNPNFSAFIFALIAIFFFQVWEAFVRYLFSIGPSIWLVSFSSLFLVVLIFVRIRTFLDEKSNKSLPRWWVISFLAANCLLLGSWGMLIGLPWIAYRSKFLGK